MEHVSSSITGAQCTRHCKRLVPLKPRVSRPTQAHPEKSLFKAATYKTLRAHHIFYALAIYCSSSCCSSVDDTNIWRIAVFNQTPWNELASDSTRYSVTGSTMASICVLGDICDGRRQYGQEHRGSVHGQKYGDGCEEASSWQWWWRATSSASTTTTASSSFEVN
jgi:hypothetical protein